MLDAIIYIGRFQPLTCAHIEIIKKAQGLAKKVIVIVGSANMARSARNPWTAEERIDCLKSVKDIDQSKLTAVALSDSNYDFPWWLGEVKKIISQNTLPNDKIGIIGHKKDETGYYLEHFKNFEFIMIDSLYKGLSATDERESLFAKNKVENVGEDVKVWIENWINANLAIFKNLKEEFEYIEDYKKSWAKSPYPPVFVTADSLVLCKDNILLVERKDFPGKGLFALPGGFMDANEKLSECAVRELKEETGLKLSIKDIKFSQIFDAPFRCQRGRVVTKVCLFDLDLPELPKITAGDDAKKVFWKPLSEIDILQDKFFSDHYKVIKKMLKERVNA